jgi:sporulation protein YlmC with PRC-barrel domain
LAREGVANDPGPYAAHKDDSSPTRHHLIASSRVNGVEVVGKDGNRAGRIRELSIEKKSGRVAYALVGTGGFLGFGERIYPVPWSLLSYDPKEEGYRVPFEKSAIIGAPTLTSEDLEWFGAGDEAWRLKTASYYNSYAQIPF